MRHAVCYVGQVRTASCVPLEGERGTLTPVQSFREFLLARLESVDVFAVLDSPMAEAVMQHVTSTLASHLVGVNLTSDEDKHQAYMDYYCTARQEFSRPADGRLRSRLDPRQVLGDAHGLRTAA